MAFILKILAGCLFMLLSLSFLGYHKKNFHTKRGYRFLFPVFVVINWSFSSWGLLLSSHYGALVLFIMVVLELKTLYSMNFVQTAFESSYLVAILYWGRGIVVPACALYLNQSVQWVRYHEFYYYLAWTLSLCLILGYNALFRKALAPKEKMEKLYQNNEQLRFVTLFQICLVGYLLFINLGRYYGLDIAWYKAAYIISCFIFCLAQIYLVTRGIKTSFLLEYELRSRLLEKQLDRQLLHYKSYQKYTESFRAFKHDYKNMMTSVKSLLSSGEYEKAERMLDTIHDTMQQQVSVHKSYSNHLILDAVLQDAANVCAEESIRFSALVYIPDQLFIEDIDLVRIFSNLIDNAAEACLKVSASDRFITVSCSVNQENGWITIEISNSYNGEVIMLKDALQTTKADKAIHGIGMTIIREIVARLGGVMQILPNKGKREFVIRIALPPTK